MKKSVLTVLLMFIAVVFGVGLRYYMQTGSLQTQKPVGAEVVDVSQPVVQETDASEDQSQTSADNDWGVVFSAEDVTPDGMTLVCTQSGGSPTGELSTGAWYELEVLEKGQWKPAPIYAEVCWEDIAWIIPKDGTTQWEVNWTWLYGTLLPGDYRIAKEIMDFRQTGDYDTCRSYAYFTIK